MDMQKIEPLLMDYALGSTTSEVAALIEALQDKDADVRVHLQQWAGVTATARHAFPEQESAGVPNFPRQRLESVQRIVRWQKTAVQSFALAACLLVGFFLGDGALEQAKVSQSSGEAMSAATIGTSSHTEMPVAAVNDFWSSSRLLAEAQRKANRPDRTSSTTVGNLSTWFTQSGG